MPFFFLSFFFKVNISCVFLLDVSHLVINISSPFTWPKVTFHCFLTHKANIQILVVYLFVHAVVHIFFNTHTNAAWSNGSFSLFFLPPPHTSLLPSVFFTSFVPHCFVLFFCSPPSFPFFVSQQVGIDQVDIPDLSQVSGTFHLNFCHVASPEIFITTSPHRPPSPASPILLYVYPSSTRLLG